MPRRGKISAADVAYVKANAEVLTVVEIAARIDRSPEFIGRLINNETTHEYHHNTVAPVAADLERVTIRQELRGTETWKRLKDEFNEDELKYFEEKYIALMRQFKTVMATEETQVFQVIKFELLMSRNLMGRKEAQQDIVRLEAMQKEFLERFDEPSQMSDDQKVFSLNLDSQIREARQNEAARTGEFVKLQERHDGLMKQLKATRDQRLEKIEREGIDFISVIKKLQERDVQDKEGRQMELMKMASKRELERLGRPHTYEDKSQDSPILCEDTVDLGPIEDIDDKSEDIDNI